MNKTLAKVASIGIVAAGLPIAGAATASAAHAATCTTTHTYTSTSTSLGTTTQRWTTRYACGSNYKKWEHVVEHSYTGSHYTEDVYRNEMSYPHYWQSTNKYYWTAKGVETHTYTVTTG